MVRRTNTPNSVTKAVKIAPYPNEEVNQAARDCAGGEENCAGGEEMKQEDRPQRITFGEMREMGVHGLLVYCADYRCSHSIAISADHWTDDLRLSDSGKPLFGFAPAIYHP